MKKALALFLLLALSACFNGTSSPSHFYTLTTPPIQPTSARSDLVIGIDRVQIARYLDRPQMITQSGQNTEATLSETHRWIEPLPDLIQRTLAENLAARLPNSLVKERTKGREPFQYLISIDLTRLDAIPGDKATLKAWWLIQDNSGKIAWREQATLTTPAGPTYQDLAQADSHLLSQLSQKIAQSLLRLK